MDTSQLGKNSTSKKGGRRGKPNSKGGTYNLPIAATPDKSHSMRSQVLTPDTTSLPVEASREQVLWAALKLSLTSGDFIDTKFYAYSRCRAEAGLVDTPRAVFASSTAIRRSAPHYFERLLSGGFSESKVMSLDVEQHTSENLHTTMYDYAYDSDSDLDDEEEDDGDNSLDIQDRNAAPSDAEIPHAVSLDTGPAEGRVVSSESQEKADDSAAAATRSIEVCASSSLTEKTWKTSNHRELPSGRQGRVVYIKDFAFRTYQAFIFYVYTGQVEFAPLKSQGNRKACENATDRKMLYMPPRCSPKSMYRLAEKYDLQDLKDLAAKDLRAKLSRDNILPEVFSGFTSRYPEISAVQVEYLCKNLEGSVLAALPEWVESATSGDLPGRGSVITSILQKVVSSNAKPAPAPAPAPLPAPQKCTYCGGVSRTCGGCGRSI